MDDYETFALFLFYELGVIALVRNREITTSQSPAPALDDTRNTQLKTSIMLSAIYYRRGAERARDQRDMGRDALIPRKAVRKTEDLDFHEHPPYFTCWHGEYKPQGSGHCPERESPLP